MQEQRRLSGHCNRDAVRVELCHADFARTGKVHHGRPWHPPMLPMMVLPVLPALARSRIPGQLYSWRCSANCIRRDWDGRSFLHQPHIHVLGDSAQTGSTHAAISAAVPIGQKRKSRTLSYLLVMKIKQLSGSISTETSRTNVPIQASRSNLLTTTLPSEHRRSRNA